MILQSAQADRPCRKMVLFACRLRDRYWK